MNTFNIGDKITTVGSFPTGGIVRKFGYIPHDNNLKVFVENENYKDSLIAIDLTWNEIVKVEGE